MTNLILLTILLNMVILSVGQDFTIVVKSSDVYFVAGAVANGRQEMNFPKDFGGKSVNKKTFGADDNIAELRGPHIHIFDKHYIFSYDKDNGANKGEHSGGYGIASLFFQGQGVFVQERNPGFENFFWADATVSANLLKEMSPPESNAATVDFGMWPILTKYKEENKKINEVIVAYAVNSRAMLCGKTIFQTKVPFPDTKKTPVPELYIYRPRFQFGPDMAYCPSDLVKALTIKTRILKQTAVWGDISTDNPLHLYLAFKSMTQKQFQMSSLRGKISINGVNGAVVDKLVKDVNTWVK